MSQNKTQKTTQSAAQFINDIADPGKRADCKALAKMMRAATGKNAKMWGSSIVGFGTYDYKYDSGREGSHLVVGFSPRAQNLSIYIMPGFGRFGPLMSRLGKHKTGRSCLYIKNLQDVDRKVLQLLIEKSVKYMRGRYYTY
jgi:hypothetical protein